MMHELSYRMYKSMHEEQTLNEVHYKQGGMHLLHC